MSFLVCNFMKINISKKKRGIFPKKAKVFLVFSDGLVVHGDGMVDATKDKVEAIFSITLVKKL